MELIKQAADRQPLICQAQSLNLFVDPEISADRMFQLHLAAWKNGVKSLYYLKSSSPLKKKDRKEQEIIVVTKDGCPYCTKLKEQLKQDGKNYKEISRQEAEDKGYWKPEFKTVPQFWEDGVRIGGYSEYMQNYHNSKASDSGECAACEG
jgi:ribonucleoside-diphosphate reductase alpha chain